MGTREVERPIQGVLAPLDLDSLFSGLLVASVAAGLRRGKEFALWWVTGIINPQPVATSFTLPNP